MKKILIALITLIFLAVIAGIFQFFGKSKTHSIIINNNQKETQPQEKNNNEFEISDNVIEDYISKETVISKVEEKSQKKPEEKTEATKNNKIDLKITNKLVSWGYSSASSRKIDTIIIHSSYDALGDDPYNISGIIAEYKQYGVSAHYLIGRDGKIYRLVEDKNIAYHAGESEVSDGRSGVNAFSIGIELVNTKTGKVTDDQYDSLKKLIAEIKAKNKIKYVLGHEDIAPGRKDDPWGFDWDKIK